MATEAEDLGKLAVRLNLLEEGQLMECLDELGPNATKQDLIDALTRKQYLTTFQVSKLEKGDTDGFFLGGYRLLYKIASGSFGRVYRADDPRTGAIVALKVLRRRWTEDPNKINLFEREGKIGMRLQHPNVVQILGVSCDRKSMQFFIVMEFVEGTNLRSLISMRTKIPVAESVRIIEESAAGLADAYAHGMTHRDIKPSNILLGTNGVAKLVDFGLTELTSSMGYSVIEDENINVDRTVDYAGLEKATEVQPGDPRSDIFFLGCVLYEMISGRAPLPPTKDRRARMQAHRFENIKPLTREDVPDAPASLFQLIDRMMSLDPQRRFQTPQQLHEAIRAVQAEVQGGPAVSGFTPLGPRTVYVVEKKDKFQAIFREKFKSRGFRVLVSMDPVRALERFQQNPFEAILLDVATVGEESLDMYERLRREATKVQTRCAGIILLDEDQDRLRTRLPKDQETVILNFPLKKGELEEAIERLLPAAASAAQ
jgi:serine/threonine protein kinase